MLAAQGDALQIGSIGIDDDEDDSDDDDGSELSDSEIASSGVTNNSTLTARVWKLKQLWSYYVHQIMKLYPLLFHDSVRNQLLFSNCILAWIHQEEKILFFDKFHHLDIERLKPKMLKSGYVYTLVHAH